MECNKEGEIVLSSVRNIAMPLIRYRTGDIGTVEDTPCSCGVAGLKLNLHAGRQVSCFRFESGALFSPSHFNILFDLFPINEFQITQLDFRHFEVLIEPKDSVGTFNGMLYNIQKYIERALPSPVTVSVETKKFEYDSKFERYRNLLASV